MGQKLKSCEQLLKSCGDSITPISRYLLFKDGDIHVISRRGEDHGDVLDTSGYSQDEVHLAGMIMAMKLRSQTYFSVDANGSHTLALRFHRPINVGQGNPEVVIAKLKELPDAANFNFQASE
ncbi:MAG: hypothetical protein M1484_01320 [Patescibacteria group bacterium]|nr:hypothetical protein [Patescibacteria group bacterium]MCL5431721.1 hypothetical protein [Patescibacteria group bacterium]